MGHCIIAGCGYVGQRLALRLQADDWDVRGLVRSEPSAARLHAAGIAAQRINLDAAIEDLESGPSTLVYYLAPPPRVGLDDPRLVNFLAAFAAPPARIVYMSTSGVYGDCEGYIVGEDQPPAPATARARRRVAAEFALRAWSTERRARWTILRVPGIYGPGRLPLERLARRDPVVRPEEAPPGNRIHVDDLVTACVRAGTGLGRDRIYNVSDGNHASFTDYALRVAAIAGLPEPPMVGAAQAREAMGSSVWSFMSESRRLDNRRLREELGVEPAYADLDAGIRASLRDEAA